MKKIILALMTLLCASANQANADIYSARGNAHGVGQFSEVIKDGLMRGGQIQAGCSQPGCKEAKSPLNQSQLQSLCEENVGEAVYLYGSNFSGPTSRECSQGRINYTSIPWDRGSGAIMKKVYQAITVTHKPVFVHCWWGIHATGAVAAMALMQFCGASSSQAIEYWKVGIAPSIQYPKVMDVIRSFRPDPSLQISSADQARVCPQLR